MKKTLTITAALLAVLTLLHPTHTAQALPPGGADSDTPGTSSSVSPTVLKACETISYTVTGFPAGQVLNIKIDDGSVSDGDPSIQGQGVVAQQRISSDGTASGSFELPCDLPAGDHWLRYLAAERSSEGGTIGYTNRGNSNFTVIADTVSESVDGTSTSTTTDSLLSLTTLSTNTTRATAAAATVQETVVDSSGNRVVVTRYVDEPAEQVAVAANANNANTNSGNSTQSTGAAASTIALGSNGQRVVAASQGTTDAGGTIVLAQSEESKPVIGLLIGGAILIVGFGAIAAYLYVNGNKRRN